MNSFAGNTRHCPIIVPKIFPKIKLRIKRVISTLQRKQEKIDFRKIIEMTGANVSIRMIQRQLQCMQFKYKRIEGIINLTKQHKEKRVSALCQWIGDQHIWEATVFNDEKRFSLDSPDDWRAYVQISQKLFRWKRQCGGASVMTWLMVLPNGLLTYRFVEGTLNADKYIDLLQISAVPIMKLNYEEDIFFQEDNSAMHKARKVQNFLISAGIKVL